MKIKDMIDWDFLLLAILFFISLFTLFIVLGLFYLGVIK